jgi:hypothetical protein
MNEPHENKPLRPLYDKAENKNGGSLALTRSDSFVAEKSWSFSLHPRWLKRQTSPMAWHVAWLTRLLIRLVA